MPNRILVVDDEENIRKLYLAELASEGYEVLVAESGESALGVIENNALDLVILDIKMAEENGLDLLGCLKEKDRKIPVVLNSAYSVYKDDFNSWLADAYVVKSSDLSELKTRIRELLSIDGQS